MTVPPITAAIDPIITAGLKPTTPKVVAKIKSPPPAMATFEIRSIFRHFIYSVGKLLEMGFDAQDLFV
jgi:hypothetical protein